ncbi:thioredoxin family protein [Butyricicoccus sp.]|uniref:thioredoxin family protein n=1 Tax=Butyricicoccus sp. TaxID=2049021 RepID=UPI003F153FEB
MAKVLHEDDFAQEIAEGKTLVEFYSDSCVPCKRMSPLLAQLEEDGVIPVYKVNIVHSRSLAVEHGVQSTPTLIVFENGRELARNHGFLNRAKLHQFLQEAGAAE